jgi:uncharacterized protein involved in outer membrane biogenesis
MRLPKEFVERKLSAALRARVAIDGLSASLLGGSIDVTGLTVTAHGSIEPLLLVRRIKADLVVGAILRKELVIKSVVIEGLTVSLVRGAEGGLNLPKRDASPAAAVSAVKEDPEDDTPSAWKFAAEKVQLLDGSVHYRDATYHASAERIVGELLRKSDGIHVTVLAAALGRRDEALDLGEARAHGVFQNADITSLGDAPLDATFEIADAVRGSVHSPSLKTQKFDVDVRAKVVLGMLRRLLPKSLLPRFYFDGQADVQIVASMNPRGGARIKHFSVTATDVRVRGDDVVAEATTPPQMPVP